MKSSLEYPPILIVVVVGLLGKFFSGTTTTGEQGKVLRAGAFAIDITPTKFPVSSAGSTQTMV